MAWFVKKHDDWNGEGPVLLIHDTCDSIAVPATELEEFLVEVGAVISQLGYFDANDLLKFMIQQAREKQASLEREK